MNHKTIFLLLGSLTFGIVLSGCLDSNSTVTVNTNNTATQSLYSDLSPKNVNVQSLKITQSSNPNTALKSNESNQIVQSHSIFDTPNQKITSGENITINVNFNAQQDYPEGIVIALDLIEQPKKANSQNQSPSSTTQSPPKIWHLDSGSVADIKVGENNLEIEAFIPYEVTSGNYVLLGHVLEDKSQNQEGYHIDQDQSIAKLPLTIYQPPAPDAELADIEFAIDYMGMSNYPEFEEDGYSVEPDIQANISVYNSSQSERELYISLDWVLENKEGSLALLDDTDDSIGDLLSIIIPPTQEEPYIVPLNAYLSVKDYDHLLNYAPDLDATPQVPLPRLELVARIYDPKVEETYDTDDNTIETELAFLLDDKLDLFYEDEELNNDSIQTKALTSRSLSLGNQTYKKILQSLLNGEVLGSEWEKTWGKKERFAIEPSTKFELKVGALPWPQASVEAGAELKFYLFEKEKEPEGKEIAKLEGSGILSARPITKINENNKTKKRRFGGALSFEFLGATIIDEDNITQEDPNEVDKQSWGAAENSKEKAKTYTTQISVSKTGTSIGKSWETDKEFTKVRFFIGPVPLSISSGIKGELKVEGNFEVEGVDLAAKAVVPAKLQAFIRGGIDAIAVAAGVQGTLDIIDIGAVGAGRFGLTAWEDKKDKEQLNIGLELKMAAFVGDSEAPEVDAFDKEKREDSKISAIRGKMGLYARARKPKICWSWGIPYPCGLDWANYNLNLYSSPWLFQRHQPIVNWSSRFELLNIDKQNNVKLAI